jgi:hypothetical protein
VTYSGNDCLVVQDIQKEIAMAQSRKLSARHTEDWVTDNCHYNDSWSDSELARQYNKPILEVGGPRLFGKPQSRVRKMPRSLGSTDRINDDDVCCDSGAYYINYSGDIHSQLEGRSIGYCNSGVYGANEDYSGLSDDDDSAYYTDDVHCQSDRFQQRRSRSLQRQPCASGPRTIQSYTVDIEPVKTAENDWREIQGLRHDLFLELSRLVLVLSIAFTQISTALAKEIGDGISWCLEEGIQRALETEHKRDWVPNARENQRDQKKDIHSFTEDSYTCTDKHPSTEACSCPEVYLSATLAASTSTPGSSTNSIDSVQPVTTMFYIPMPLPGTPGSPMFKGANVTEFLERYKDLCLDYHVSASDKFTRLPWYCI